VTLFRGKNVPYVGGELMLDLRVRAFALAVGFAASGVALFGQQHTVTLHGKLFRAPDVECGFFLDPLGDSSGLSGEYGSCSATASTMSNASRLASDGVSIRFIPPQSIA